MRDLEYMLTPSCEFFLRTENDCSGGSSVWNLPMCVEVKQYYDHTEMKKAVNRVISENDALRCVVTGKKDGKYKVSFLPFAELEPEVISINENDREKAIKKAIKEAEKFAAIPMDIYNEIPIKVKSFIISEVDFIFIVVIHHYVADAVGLAVAGGKILNYFTGEASSISNRLTRQFSDYLKMCEEFSKSEKFAYQEKYWDDEFLDYKFTASELKRGTSADLKRDHYFTLSRPFVYEFARQNNTTIFNVILLAVHILYGELFDTADTISGFIVSDRKDPRYAAATGNYTRLLGTRLKLDRKMTFCEALRNLMKKTVYGSENSAAGDCRYPIPFCVSYQEAKQSRKFSGVGDVEFIGISIPHRTPYLMMSVIEKSDVVGIGIAADAGVYSDEYIEIFGNRITQIIRDFILAPNKKLVDYLSEGVFQEKSTELIII